MYMQRLSSVIKNWLQLATNFIIYPKLGVFDALKRINKMGRGFFVPVLFYVVNFTPWLKFVG
jgi:hypothetical protein